MPQRLNLVTGACGFTGMYLIRQLLEQGQKVIATDLRQGFESPKAKMITQKLGVDFSHKNCTVIPADLTKKDSLVPLFEKPVTHIFHTASLYDYSAPMEMLERVNVLGGKNIFDLAVQHQGLVRFIHWSTCGVFGKPYRASDGRKCNTPFNEDVPGPKNTPLDKDAPAGTHLVNDYSVTKFKQEQMAWQAHREQGLPLTVVRPAPIYGPGSDYGHGGIVLAINRGLLPAIPADSKNYITTSVHATDVAGFARFIAEKDFALGEDYNVVDDSIISYHDFLHYLALLLGRKIRNIPLLKQTMLRPAGIWAAKTWLWLEKNWNVPRVRVLEVGSATYMSSSYWISNKKTKDAGYTYRYPDVREGMRDTIDWFRQVGWLDPAYSPEADWKDKVA